MGRLAAAMILAAAPAIAAAQSPYVPDVTEAREKEWRKETSAAQSAYASGRMEEGAKAARQALTLAEDLFGPDDPRTLISATDLALNLDALKQDDEAEALLRRAFDAYVRTRGETDPNSQTAAENLIDFYIARKRYDAARELGQWALESARRTSGGSSAQSRRMETLLQSLPAPAPQQAAAAPEPPPAAETNAEPVRQTETVPILPLDMPELETSAAHTPSAPEEAKPAEPPAAPALPPASEATSAPPPAETPAPPSPVEAKPGEQPTAPASSQSPEAAPAPPAADALAPPPSPEEVKPGEQSVVPIASSPSPDPAPVTPVTDAPAPAAAPTEAPAPQNVEQAASGNPAPSAPETHPAGPVP